MGCDSGELGRDLLRALGAVSLVRGPSQEMNRQMPSGVIVSQGRGKDGETSPRGVAMKAEERLDHTLSSS